MKKKLIKTFVIIATIAVSFESYNRYGSCVVDNMIDNDLLLAENVLALSDPKPNEKTKDGGFEDCDIIVCSGCNLAAPFGTCMLGLTCEYNVPKAGHRYNCKGGNRLTEAECTALIKAFPPHLKETCTGHVPEF